MAPVTFRPFVESDRPGIEALLAPRFDNEHPLMRRRGYGLHLPDAAGGMWHRTIVAEEGGTIIGVGSAMEMSWHPHVRLADVMVGESARRRRVGSALLEGVREQVRAAGNEKLFGQIRPNSPGGREFAEARGFTMIMRSRFWRFDPADPAIRAWTQQATRLNHGYRVEPVPATDPRVAQAIHDLYTWMHAGWNPLGPVSVATFEKSFGPNIVPGSAFLALREGIVAGVSNLSRSPSMPSMRPFVSMVGVTDPALPDAPALTSHLAALAFERAHALGKGLEAEADDAHVHLGDVLARLPSIGTDQLLQFAG